MPWGGFLPVEPQQVRFREVSSAASAARSRRARGSTATEPAGEVLDAMRKTAGASALISVELFDRYEGKGVPEGKVSLAFRLVFQRADRTSHGFRGRARPPIGWFAGEPNGGELG